MLAVQSPERANDANATSVRTAARSPPNRQTRSVPATVVPTHVSHERSSVNQATSSSTKMRNPSKIVKIRLLSSAERCSISHDLELVELELQRVPGERARPRVLEAERAVRDPHAGRDERDLDGLPAPPRAVGEHRRDDRALGDELGHRASPSPAIARRTASRSTTPTTRSPSTARTGSLAPREHRHRVADDRPDVEPRPVEALVGRRLAHDPAQRQDMAARHVADEVLDVLVRGRADELLGRPELDDRAVAHDRDPVAEAKRLGQVVRDEDHRLARLGLEPADLVLHVSPDQRVERAERLVVEHHRRVRREGARDADALLHAAGELVRELVLHVLQPDELEELTGAERALLLRHAADLEPERDVVDHAPVCEEAEVLEHHRDRVAPELPQLGRARRRHVLLGDPDRPRGRLDQPDQRPDERRLARAGEAHDDEHLAAPDVEGDVAHRRDAAGLLAKLRPAELGVRCAEDAVRLGAEDLPDARGRDERLTGSPVAGHAADISVSERQGKAPRPRGGVRR